MRSMLAVLSVVCVWASAVLPASAGWDNVFQPTLFERCRQPTVAQYYVAPAVVAQYPPVVVAQYQPPVVVAQSSPCNTCPQPSPCTTRMVLSYYYQPVTAYQNKTVLEPVTTMQTSYYYEPVTSVRYSSYYDPCRCGYVQVGVPQTTLELRAKQCPVQSWVSRCVPEPVTIQEKRYQWVPQTTCCQTTIGAPVISTPPPPMLPAQSPIPDVPPSIRGEKTQGMGLSKPPMWNQFYPPIEKTPANSTPGASYQPRLGLPMPVQPLAPAAQPPVKLNQIAVGPDSRVEGQVVRSDSSPKPNAKVLFINASTGKRQIIHANTAGRFLVDLPAGSWHVYLHGADDVPIYQNRIDVNGAQTRSVRLVSRSN